MPLDHVSYNVPKDNLEDFLSFLTKSLEHLGFKELYRPIPTVVLLGEEKAYFCITAIDRDSKQGFLPRQHIAFTAKNAEEVHQFHTAALKAGGICNGKPGLRDYHPGYYGAFVLDPFTDLNLEVVYHNGADA